MRTWGFDGVRTCCIFSREATAGYFFSSGMYTYDGGACSSRGCLGVRTLDLTWCKDVLYFLEGSNGWLSFSCTARSDNLKGKGVV